ARRLLVEPAPSREEVPNRRQGGDLARLIADLGDAGRCEVDHIGEFRIAPLDALERLGVELRIARGVASVDLSPDAIEPLTLRATFCKIGGQGAVAAHEQVDPGARSRDRKL